MKKLKGIGLLLIANILIFITLSISFTVLSEMILPAFGIDLRGSIAQMDLLWAFVIGFGGAFISLAFSKQMARAFIDCTQITEPRNQAERIVFDTVQKISEKLGISMPEVWIYESPDPNAFATGPTKNNSMVAVSTGLLNNLNEGEVRAVLAHEMGHVYNGDMFTTTVLAGLMNTFVYFISRFIYRQVAERNEALGFGVYIVLQIVLSVLAMIPISWWSRRREFAADRFAANTVGKEHMISALEGIDRWVQRTQFEYSSQDALATMKISGKSHSFMQIFATHPPIEARVNALRQL
ncbi:protease HtpX [Candidatus Nitrospira allomarina]|jgi:heat shock protein HtpX|uniref:Protease HtpX n=1 Tax=Candidatus Nitrospira allomarina TaxID=3020900 RepID=A0AA96GAB6_9BACT|nr:protease HtpX [Candidatus Nitrospira allomarina]WNM57367.1 protease HtpX [Candidatus Nitrospira allomarina]